MSKTSKKTKTHTHLVRRGWINSVKADGDESYYHTSVSATTGHHTFCNGTLTLKDCIRVVSFEFDKKNYKRKIAKFRKILDQFEKDMDAGVVFMRGKEEGS